MSSDLAVRVAIAAPTAALPNSDGAIYRFALRRVVVGALVCAVAFGGTVASSAMTYVSTFPDDASRAQLASSTSAAPGFEILMGSTDGIGTVGGYTVYKTFVFLTCIGAVWGLLAGTRLLRGEEDAGRWQLVLAGATTARRATSVTLIALHTGVAGIFLGTAGLTLLAARDPAVGFAPGETALFGLSLALPVAVFASIGAVASQLGRTRRTATGLGAGAFAVAMVVRMVGDADPATSWVLWASPFGWTELTRPFTENNVAPVVVAFLATVALSGSAVVLAGRRDLGQGLFTTAEEAAPRLRGLGSPTALTARLAAGSSLAWCLGMLATGLVFGVVARLSTMDIPESMSTMLDRFGVAGGFQRQFLGVVFLFVAFTVALIPAGQLGAAADEEESGRLVHLLAGTVRRATWFGGRLVFAGALLLTASVLAAGGTWIGARSQGVDVDLGEILAAGLNVVPTGLLVLGLGSLVLAVRPRWAAPFVYAAVGWSLVVDLLGSLVTDATWLRQLSLFHHMALLPAQEPNPTAITVSLAVALVAGALATSVFSRRDVASV